jgi:hypothetical protein
MVIENTAYVTLQRVVANILTTIMLKLFFAPHYIAVVQSSRSLHYKLVYLTELLLYI